MRESLRDRNLFGTFPIRYAWPFILGWLLARQLRRRAAAAALAVRGGRVACSTTPSSGSPRSAPPPPRCCDRWAARRELGTLAIEAAVGLVARIVLVSALTLALPVRCRILTCWCASRGFRQAGWGCCR